MSGYTVLEVAEEVYRRLSRLHLRAIYSGLGAQIRATRGMNTDRSVLLGAKGPSEKRKLVLALASEGRDLFRDCRDAVSEIFASLQDKLPVEAESERIFQVAEAIGVAMPDYLRNDPVTLCTVATVLLKFGNTMRLTTRYRLLGKTTHFTISYESDGGASAERAAAAVMTLCETNYDKSRIIFGAEPFGLGLPIAVFIDDDDFGAYIIDDTFDEIHCSLSAVSGQAFSPEEVAAMVTAEMAHAFTFAAQLTRELR